MKKQIIVFVLLFIPFSAFPNKHKTDSLQGVVHSNQHDTSKVKALNELGKTYLYHKVDSALFYFDSAYSWSKKINFKKEEANCLNFLGVVALHKNDLDSAKFFFEKSHAISSQIGFKKRQAATAGNLAIVYERFGNTIMSNEYFRKAIGLYEQIGDSAQLSKNQVDFSRNLATRGSFPEALEILLLATRYFEKHNDDFQLIFAYINLGSLYYNLQDFDLSLKYYLLAIEKDRQVESIDYLALSLNGIGLIYAELKKDTQKAAEYYQQAIEEANEFNYESTLISVTNNLANMYFDKKDFDKALDQYKIAYRLYEKSNFHSSEIPITINLGVCNLYLGNLDSARHYLYDGLEKAESAASAQHIAIAHKNLFELDSTLGNFVSAIEHLKISEAIKDSLWQQENQNKIKELGIRFETEKKEQENTLLKDENQLKARIIQNHRIIGAVISLALVLMIVLGIWLYRSRKKLKDLNARLEAQKLELQQLNVTKDKFFSIVAHDLKSPFNSLLGLLDMLEEDFDSISDEDKMEIITSLRKSSHNTYHLLLNLLDWSRNQRGHIKFEPQKFSVEESIQNVFKLLRNRAKFKSHQLTSVIPDDLVMYTDKIMFESVILNLVNNSIKFTNNGGDILISVQRVNGGLFVSIRDNGVGIPSENIAHLFELDSDFKRMGTSDEMGTGLGLILCNDFVHLMGGVISVESKENQGSVFSFTIPE
ncbi:MAG: tetratricopeptide repeat-containing sensor histidine kinase [Bacteroidales bacterium]|nr:tetratricopeptide repeat-containing sensor histidine kinase [Bacteroidales bacterium]MCF8457385.1 tetratricopeptide repeat-containing sensor histidine kinase [Bacteroidales bacterium]